MLFATRACLVCHGWNAVAGGGAPDLRYSPAITDAATFRTIVKEGGLKLNGMPPFPQFTDKELEDLRFYLRGRRRASRRRTCSAWRPLRRATPSRRTSPANGTS